MAELDKNSLRKQALDARNSGGDADALTRNLRQVLAPWRDHVVAGYWPIRGEADPLPAILGLHAAVCLPVVVGPARPLIFRKWSGREDELETGKFATRHPQPTAIEVRPRVVVVPLAGFDRAGNRLGYGGGFYDRTLETLRQTGPVLAVACAYGVQELPLIPVEPTDQPLDLIVTDREIIRP